MNIKFLFLSVSQNLRSLIYKYHIQNTLEYFDNFDIFNVYELTTDPQEKSDVLNAVSQTRLEWLLDSYKIKILLKSFEKAFTT